MPVEITFRGKLYPHQELAAKDVLSRRQGLAILPTGAGKTVLACYIIAERGQKSAVLVHNKELLYQWKDRLIEFLGLEGGEIGLIGDSKYTIGTKVTVCIINSALKHLDELTNCFGLIIVDECHRTPARTFTDVLSNMNSYFSYGLSATPYRADGLNKVIHLYIGDKLHEVKADSLIRENRIAQARLIVHPTEFTCDIPSDQYQEIVTSLITDYHRTWLIVGNVIDCSKNNDGICLLVSDRVWHAEQFRTILGGQGISAALLVGKMTNRSRIDTHERIKNSDVKVLVATTQLIGEGFDLPDLSSIHFSVPMKSL